MDIEVEEKDIIDYKKRRNKSIKSIIIICIIILILSARSENFPLAFAIVMLLFGINYYRSIKSDTYLLTKLKIDNDNVYLNYFRKDERIEVEGEIGEFRIYKRHEISKSVTPYLYIQHNNVQIIRQYQYAIWTSKRMDEVVDYFRAIKNANM